MSEPIVLSTNIGDAFSYSKEVCKYNELADCIIALQLECIKAGDTQGVERHKQALSVVKWGLKKLDDDWAKLIENSK
jgi:hypothetical protein